MCREEGEPAVPTTYSSCAIHKSFKIQFPIRNHFHIHTKRVPFWEKKKKISFAKIVLVLVVHEKYAMFMPCIIELKKNISTIYAKEFKIQVTTSFHSYYVYEPHIPFMN